MMTASAAHAFPMKGEKQLLVVEDDVSIELARCEPEVVFSIRDTGPGVPPDELPHIFDRFWQAKRTARQGAGLGLAIVKGLVEAHGGRIWVESTVGQGTLFSFSLPT